MTRYQQPNVPVADVPLGTYDWLRLSEGWCPHSDHGRLGSVPELPNAGWCDTCGLGWSMPRGVPIVEMRPLDAQP